jgi:hypothetical protein
MIKALKDVHSLPPSDRQLRQYEGEYYIPEWVVIKLIRHRGPNGSLTINNEDESRLHEILLNKSCVHEFIGVQVFVRNRKTAFRANLQWQGNGAAVVLEDGFRVYEATSIVVAYYLDDGTPEHDSEDEKVSDDTTTPSPHRRGRKAQVINPSNWVKVKLIRHRGVDGSLTIYKETASALRNALLNKSCVEEFRSAQVFVHGRKTPVAAELKWLGNGAALCLMNGELVCKATRTSESIVDTTSHQQTLGTQKCIMERATAPEMITSDAPARKAVLPNSDIMSEDPQAITALKEIQMNDSRAQVMKQSSEQKAPATTNNVERSGHIGNTAISTNRVTSKARHEKNPKTEYNSFVLDITLHSRVPSQVKSRVERAMAVLEAAINVRTSLHHRILMKTGAVTIRVFFNNNKQWEKTITAQDYLRETGGHREHALNGVTQCGPYKKYQYWQCTSGAAVTTLRALIAHAVFAERVSSIKVTQQLGDAESAKTMLDEVVPSEVDFSLMSAVFGEAEPDSGSLVDTYSEMYIKLVDLLLGEDTVPTEAQSLKDFRADLELESMDAIQDVAVDDPLLAAAGEEVMEAEHIEASEHISQE